MLENFTRCIIISLLLLACAACSSGYRVYISGDGDSSDAKIFIDNKLVGLMMKKKSQRNKVPADQQVEQANSHYSIGVDLDAAKNSSNLEIYDQINVEPGIHEILFIKDDGRKLEKRVVVKSELYIHVNFEKMIIQGGGE